MQVVLPIWKEIGSVFNSGNNTKLKINFYSEGAATTGNDYAVDDISLRTITQPTFVPIKEVSNEYAKIGDIVTYTISVTNTCNNLLTDVIITDTVPTGLEFVQGSVIYNGVSNPDANPNDGIQIGTIGSGKTATITYEARVSQITADPIINNTANLQYGYTPILGEVPRVFNEESNRVPLYVGQAIIGGSTPNSSFTKSADKEVVNVGDIITYTIIAKNIGNVQARNVVITDLLSSDVSYIEGSLNSTVEITGNPLYSISLTNPLGVDEQARITFDVRVNQLPSDNQITNSASVTFNYTENPEKPYAAIGRGVTNTVNTIVANPTLSIIKSQDINTVIVGDVVTYTLDVTNTGNLTYTNVIVSDPVQPKLTFIPGSVTINGEVSSGNIEEGVNIGDLSPNKKVIIRFRARVNDNQSSRFIDNVGETQYNVVIGDISEELNKSSNKVTLEVLNASLKVNKISNTDILMVGEVFEYIVNVENTGDVELKDVNLFDNFPSQFKVLNVFVDNTVMQNTKVNNFNIGNLEPGQIKNIRIILKVVNDGLINFKNTITAIGKAQIGTTKPVITVKDTATDVNSVSIIQRSNVEVIKRANKRCICVGDVITYTITVNNNSNISIGTSNEPVILYDYLSLNSKFIYGSLKINNVKVNNVDINNGINLGTLQPNEKKTVQFSVEVYDCYDYYYVINSAKIVYGYRVINGATITNSESSNVLRIPIV